MKRFLKSTWFKILSIILAVLIILTVVAGVIGSHSSPVSTVAGTAAQPFVTVFSYIGRGFKQIGAFFVRPSSYEKKIKELEGQVTDYQKQLAGYETDKEKLQLYEDFLGIKEENKDYEVISATAIAKDASSGYTTFVFNKGTASGVKVNDPVICGKGQLVGVVTKVAPTYCVVSTILDPSISISAYDIRSRENGYITNTSKLADKGLCRLSGLDRSTEVSKGGIICTAGVGGIYPRDLVIGTVQDVKNDEYDISAYAEIKPNVDITEIDEALILISFDGQGISVGSSKGKGEAATSPDIQKNKTKESDEESTAASSGSTAQRTTSTRRVTTWTTSASTTQATTQPTTRSTTRSTTADEPDENFLGDE